MEAISIMMEDHRNIRRMTSVMNRIITSIRNTKEVNEQDLRDVVDFCRGYADEHHHAKEEKILFPELLKIDFDNFDGMINHVMLVEHDEGRKHATGIETNLNKYLETQDEKYLSGIIIELSYYIQTLNEYTEKEDECLYVFAENALPASSKEYVDALTKEKQQADIDAKIVEHYLTILERLEKTYA